MSAGVVPIGLTSLMCSPAQAYQAETSDTALDNFADLLSALSLEPLRHPMLDLEGGLRFEWVHRDEKGRRWDLRAVIEASGGLYLVALGAKAALDDELYLEHFDAELLIRFVTTGTIPHDVAVGEDAAAPVHVADVSIIRLP